MIKLILLVFVTSLVTTLSLNYEIVPAVVATCDIFNRSGITCRDCETLSRCVLMNGVWESYDVEKCDASAGFHCNSFEERCSNSTGPCHRTVQFACSEEGYFPNPFTCQEYYVCVKLPETSDIVSFQRFCDSGFSYSAATQACTLRLNDAACLKLQWQCSFPGDLGLWPGSDDIFYLCLRNPGTNELVPELHKCLNDQIFDGTNCVARNSGTSTTPSPGTDSTESSTSDTITTDVTSNTGTTDTSSTGSSTETSVSTSTDTSSTDSSTETSVSSSTDTSSTDGSESTTTAPFTCTTSGLFPNPNNCRQYYVCDSDLMPDLRDCPNGTYFVPETYSCIFGNC